MENKLMENSQKFTDNIIQTPNWTKYHAQSAINKAKSDIWMP